MPAVDTRPYTFDVPAGFPALLESDANPTTRAKVKLGKRLFYDPILSADFSVSCNSCHKQEFAFADHRAISPGVDGALGFRNAPSLANVAYLGLMHKDGGVPKLDMQAATPIEDAAEMNLSIFDAAERLNADAEYVSAFQLAFGRKADAFTITRALAAFQKTMISGHSAYDQYINQQDDTALSEAAIRGMALFFSEELACSSCHAGFNFTNNAFLNNGSKLDYSDDPGRFRISWDSLEVGSFRVPSLRNVALTSPYMHNGSMADLDAVLEHYKQGGQGHPLQDERIRPLDISAAEIEDLKAFLNSLTDEQFITDEQFRME